MVIVDPGIKVDHGYRSYDNGMDLGVFLRVCILTGTTYVLQKLLNLRNHFMS